MDLIDVWLRDSVRLMMRMLIASTKNTPPHSMEQWDDALDMAAEYIMASHRLRRALGRLLQRDLGDNHALETKRAK